jgi:DNA polymerase elongation subunit (family B)
MGFSDRLLALAPRDPAPRILTLDIETSPAIVMAWGLFDQNIGTNQIVEPSRVICFAAKWHDKRATEFYSEHHHSHKEMVRQAWRLLDECTVLVTYNGPGFDVKHLQREFFLAGLGPPSPWVDVDLLAVNRRRFKFLSNKLGYVTDALSLPTKMETGGMQLWTDVLKGDAKAWNTMRAYCKRDVGVTELLYNRLAVEGWIKGLPHAGQWTRDRECCPQCGGNDLDLVGLVYGKTTAYPKLHCNGCGAWVKVLRNGDTRLA